MKFSKKQIDEFFSEKVKITLDDGTTIKGYLKGTADHPQADYYDSIYITRKSDDLANGDNIPLNIIADINFD